MRASSLLIVRDAALAGVGIALLPRSIIRSRLKAGELVQWGTTGKVVELWVLHTSRRLPSAKVRAFVDFMRDQYPDGTLVLPADRVGQAWR
jgi:DNA-binding transcriptional LysR family regulator